MPYHTRSILWLNTCVLVHSRLTGEGKRFVEHTPQPEIQTPLHGVWVENCLASQRPVLGRLAPPAGQHRLALQQLFLFIAVFSGVLFLKLLPPSLPTQNKNIICHVRRRMSKIKYTKPYCTMYIGIPTVYSVGSDRG